MWIWILSPGLAVNQSNSSIFTHPLFFGAGGLLEQGHNPAIKQGRQNACDTLLEFNLLFSFPGIFYDRIIEMNPIVCRHFRNQFTDKIIGNNFQLFKTDTGFPHIQFARAVFGVFTCEPFQKLWVGINAHVVNCNKVFLGGDA